MSYVDENLVTSETIIYEAKVHWIVYLPSVISFLIAIFLMPIGMGYTGPIVFDIGVSFAVMAILLYLEALINVSTTELVITSKRVIAKTGFISRNTSELNHSKVEGFEISQSIIERIFDCGTIAINGTGSGKAEIKNIYDPLNFRKQAMKIIDRNQKNKEKRY